LRLKQEWNEQIEMKLLTKTLPVTFRYKRSKFETGLNNQKETAHALQSRGKTAPKRSVQKNL